MTLLGLAGDTMLGRMVAEALTARPPASLVSPELVEIARSADAVILNLECCISERGERWPARGKPFFFRAPPAAVEVLTLLGVRCVTLANNHALDYGETALLDTFEHLDRAGIAFVGAGSDLASARAPRLLDLHGTRLAVIGVTDHPEDFAASSDRPGVAWAPLSDGVPSWLVETVSKAAAEVDAVLVTPHWGPNMVAEPLPHVRRAARALIGAGASFVAGHSAHVFHGVQRGVAFDLGDFLDDYATDPVLRNDLGLFFLLRLDGARPVRLEGVPIKLDFCHTGLARGEDAAWIRKRFRAACARLGTSSGIEDGRVVVNWPRAGAAAS